MKTYLILIGALFIMGCSATGNVVAENKAVDFTVLSIDREVVSLSQLNSDGKPVLLYFFASWCPNCARDLAALQEVYPEYENDVTLIAVDVDPNESPLQIDAYKNRYPGLQKGIFAQADRSVLSSYNVRYTTTKFAIKDGEIIFSNIGSVSQEQWKQILDQLRDL